MCDISHKVKDRYSIVKLSKMAWCSQVTDTAGCSDFSLWLKISTSSLQLPDPFWGLSWHNYTQTVCIIFSPLWAQCFAVSHDDLLVFVITLIHLLACSRHSINAYRRNKFRYHICNHYTTTTHPHNYVKIYTLKKKIGMEHTWWHVQCFSLNRDKA